jgi:hypothetical protein|tara:strand:- start:650 stop:1063 length:414 start_codon:yes stop_codon:yes gene_type:complete
METPNQLVEVLDIAMAGYRKENEAFVISILYKEEEMLQIINQNMTEETKSETGEFGIVLSICFDTAQEKEVYHRFTHSHFKFDSTPALDTTEELASYFLPLANNSEKSAKIICKLLTKVYEIKSTQHLDFEMYEVEA